MDLEAICAGWLIKSPSSKYVTLFSRGKISIRVPLKSKWHRRYFVLHKPQGSLPHQYAFDYFKGEMDMSNRRRGSINLEECETILSNLDSSHYNHLFSIKTKARDKDRVYYLAADSDEDMMKWVNCLCSLCGLKMGTSEVLGSPASSILASPPPAENHIVAPNPPIRQDSIQLTVDLPAQKTLSNQSLVNEDLSNQILDEIEAREKGHMVVEDRRVEDSEQLGYTELSECTTGHNGNGEFIELYDVPKSQRLAPPTRLGGQSQSVRSRAKPSTSTLTCSRSANSSPMMSRTLPSRHHNEPLAPPRPPKPSQYAEEHYQNISSNSPILHRSNQPSPALSRFNGSRSTSEKFIFPSKTLPLNHSVGNSPSASRKTSAVNGRLSPAIDTLYHNTADFTHTETRSCSSSSVDARQRQKIDQLYDVPRSCNPITVAVPPPSLCTGNTTQTVHKYVNASAGIVSNYVNNNHKNGGDSGQTEHVQSPSEEILDLVRQPVDENHYDLSPTTRVTDRPDRPYKPRNLSDQTTLDSLEDDAFQGSHSVLKVSKSFRTRAFTKDSVFSDSEDPVPPCTHEDIKLPSRINTNDSSSSSQIDSSSDEEDVDIENKNKVESEYDVLPPPKDVQPLLPARLHNKPLSHTHTMDSIKLGVNTSPFNVKRSSSMSQVLPPPHGSMSKLPNMGGASPNLALRHQKQLRSERSSSVCANDWRNKTADINSTGLSQIMPVHRPVTPVAGDIQYIELEQNQERAEPSPKPSRSSLSSTNFTANSNFLEYTDIDILKTQALTETRRERDLNLRKKSENQEP